MSLRTSRRSSLFNSIAALAMMGLLAGAIGGFGVGLLSKAGSSLASSTAHQNERLLRISTAYLPSGFALRPHAVSLILRVPPAL
jgi:hypothetical protein